MSEGQALAVRLDAIREDVLSMAPAAPGSARRSSVAVPEGISTPRGRRRSLVRAQRSNLEIG